MSSLTVRSLAGLPEIAPGADLAELIVALMSAQEPSGSGAPRRPSPRARGLRDGDVLAIAHKVVSKAEGALVHLNEVQPTARARELAADSAWGSAGGPPTMAAGARDAAFSRSEAGDRRKDPRLVQVVLDQAAEVLRAERGVIVCRTHHGFVCANAGVDASNAGDPDTVVVLPRDPDVSARRTRARLRELTGANVGVLITDSFGRPWRHGQCDVAIGCAGLSPLDDWRGRTDSAGLELRATWLALADAIAATADLARGKDSREPVVVVEGLERFVTEDDGPGAVTLIRRPEEDLFR